MSLKSLKLDKSKRTYKSPPSLGSVFFIFLSLFRDSGTARVCSSNGVQRRERTDTRGRMRQVYEDDR